MIGNKLWALLVNYYQPHGYISCKIYKYGAIFNLADPIFQPLIQRLVNTLNKDLK